MRKHVKRYPEGILASAVESLFRRGHRRIGKFPATGLETLESRVLLSTSAPGDPLNIAPLVFSSLQLPEENSVPAGVSDQLWAALQVSDNPDAVYAVGARSDGQGDVQAYLNLDANADAATVASDVSGLGLTVDTWNDDMHVVQAWINPNSVDSLLALSGVESLDVPDYGVPNTGAVESTGNTVLRANLSQNLFGFTGAGVKVGVISSGVDHRANSVASGDLPAVTVNAALPGSGDEGTAMLEIIHDLAPNAQLYFSDGLTSADLINSITYLQNQGCRVIVDDLSAFSEPYFADGPIAQAAQAAVNAGVVYVTSAGNAATPATYYGTSHYQAVFNDDGGGNHFHNFATTGVNDVKSFYIDPNTQLTVTMQWSEAFGAAASNYGLYIVDTNGNIIAQSTGATTTPRRNITITNNGTTPVTVGAAINLIAGNVNRQLEMFGYRSGGTNPTGSTAGLNFAVATDAPFSQEAVTSVITVGASDATDANHGIEPFSSQGPSTIFTNFANQTYVQRQSIEVTGVDDVQTEVGQLGYFNNPFFGTSAAAPHIAAIAALMLQAVPTLTPAQVEAGLNSSALDLGAAGYDNVYGAGLVRADYAVATALTVFSSGTLTITGTSLADTLSLTTSGGVLTVGYNGASVTPSGTITSIVVNGGSNDVLTVSSLPSTVTALTLNGGGTIDLDAGTGVTQTFSGVLAGSGARVVKTGSGTWTLTGSNTFSGNTRLGAGVLSLDGSGGLALAGTTLDMDSTSDTGSLSFGTLTSATIGGLTGARNLALSNAQSQAVMLTVGANSATTTYSGVLSGTGSGLIKTGTGTLILTGTNTYTGGTTVTAGTLQIGNGDGTGSIDGGNVAITSPSILAFNRIDTITLTGAITGNGTLAQQGTGTLVLSNANNSYTGDTDIASGGTIEFAANASIGRVVGDTNTYGGALVVDAGQTVTSKLLVHVGLLTVNGTWKIAANGNLTNRTATIGTLTIAGSGPSSWTGLLDLTNNNLIVGTVTNTTSFANIANQIIQAAGIPNPTNPWNGTGGITSTSAQLAYNNSNGTRTALGYITGSDYTGMTGLTLFDGLSFNPTDTLIKYTLVGDANLDGTVNIDDFYALSGHINQFGWWYQGNFDYYGNVTFDDFLRMSDNFNKTLTAGN